MKLQVIGVGDCGCRVAAEFARLNRQAKVERRVSIITGIYAINNNKADLKALPKVRVEKVETILLADSPEEIKLSDDGAQLMRERLTYVTTAITEGKSFGADGFLIITGSAGGFGSGGTPVLAQQLKGYYQSKPLYAMVILPFESENEKPHCIYNTAVCLNSISKVADAVFLVDNDRFKGSRDETSGESLTMMNREIVLPFYDFLCASEVAGTGYAGARSIGTGDLMQTLSGWTTVGIGETRLPRKGTKHFQEKGAETLKALEAMNTALNRLSTECRLENAGKALYLLSAPSKEANIDMAQALGNKLLELTGNGEIRGGDFYGTKDSAQVTVIVSQLIYIEQVKNYYDRAVEIARELKEGKPD